MTLGPLAPLAAYRQFIVSMLVPLANGKTNKLPINWRTGQVCDAQDPANWCSYDEAAAVVARCGQSFRVGFVLTAADPFFCLDIDSCATPTGWSELASSLCAQLPGTAVEVSQSGRGLHVWGRRSTMPEHAQKRIDLGIELYSRLRFLVLGHGAVGTMSDDCTAIDAVAAAFFPPRERVAERVGDDGPRADWNGPPDTPEGDADLLRRAMMSKSARSVFGGRATFADLYHADERVLSRAYPPDASSSDPYDRSSADLALAQHLAFWTGCDVARIERLMRQSALVRDKYDRADYLVGRTIATACGQQRDVLQDKPSPPTGHEVADRLRFLTRAEISAQWLAATLPLDEAQRAIVIDDLNAHVNMTPAAMRRLLRQADAAATRDRSEREFAERHAGQTLIERQPGGTSEQAAQVGALIVATAKPGDYVSFAGTLARVTVAPLPYTHAIDDPEGDAPPVPQIERLTRAGVVAHVERVAQFFETTQGGRRKPIDVPDGIVGQLLDAGHHAAPLIVGVATHPLVRHDGSILATDGLHGRLFLAGANIGPVHPYSQADALAAFGRLRATFLEGFEFASPLDEDVAIAGLIAGVQRRMMASAPGLAVLAATQSSGKTTLARRLHVLLTGHDMPVSAFPMGDEAEMGKRLLSALIRNPEMLCFDNLADGATLASPVLAAAMTAPVFTQRILGESRDVSAPTSVLFVATGNNLNLGNDEATRWLVARLQPNCARPEERRFAHADVVGHARRNRPSVLRDVVGIVAGYLRSGAASAGVGARFPDWDRMVRQPLLWAGASDVAQVFRLNAADAEGVNAWNVLAWALRRTFGDRAFKAGELVAVAQGPHDVRDTIRGALESLGVRDIDKSRSVGQKLMALRGKVAEVEGVGLKLDAFDDPHDKVKRYRMLPVV